MVIILNYKNNNYRMVNFTVDSNYMKNMYYVDKLDNIGPAYRSSIANINDAIMKIKVVK